MSRGASLKVIELNDSEESVFVVRYPLLNNCVGVGTKLIVKQNQVAVFVDDGEVMDVLKEGTHILNAEILSKLAAKRGWKKNFSASFYCEIYFVSLTLFSNVKWGMVNSLVVRDNDFGSVALKCFGNFSFKVVDASLFIKELFGKIARFNNEDISLYLKTLIVVGITNMFLNTRISALDFVCNYDKFEMEDFSDVKEKFTNCGLLLQRLNIENVTVNEEVQRLVDIKIKEKMEENHNLSKANDGRGYTSSMRKIFNFTHDLTLPCVKCGALVSRGFKYCPQCGEENKEVAMECPICHNIVAFKAKYCPDCGGQLFDKEHAHFCKHCGKIVSSNDLYCPECGKVL